MEESLKLEPRCRNVYEIDNFHKFYFIDCISVDVLIVYSTVLQHTPQVTKTFTLINQILFLKKNTTLIIIQESQDNRTPSPGRIVDVVEACNL